MPNTKSCEDFKSSFEELLEYLSKSILRDFFCKISDAYSKLIERFLGIFMAEESIQIFDISSLQPIPNFLLVDSDSSILAVTFNAALWKYSEFTIFEQSRYMAKLPAAARVTKILTS